MIISQEFENSELLSQNLVLLVDELLLDGNFAHTTSLDKVRYNLRLLDELSKPDDPREQLIGSKNATFVFSIGVFIVIVVLTYNESHMMFFNYRIDTDTFNEFASGVFAPTVQSNFLKIRDQMQADDKTDSFAGLVILDTKLKPKI